MLQRMFRRERTQAEGPAAACFPSILDEADIRLTAAARERMRLLMSQADEDLVAVRIFVMGGGCGGMTYGMTYAERLNAHDTVLEGEGYRIVVDAVALGYLRGCTIDYAKQGLNESFVFHDVFQSVGGSGLCSGCGAAGSGRF